MEMLGLGLGVDVDDARVLRTLAHTLVVILSHCSVALLLGIVDLICVGSSVMYVCVRRYYSVRV